MARWTCQTCGDVAVSADKMESWTWPEFINEENQEEWFFCQAHHWSKVSC